MKLKITQNGDSAVIILPKTTTARLHPQKGDEFCTVETKDGLKVARYDQAFARQMDVAENVMRKNHNMLRKLADS